MPFLKVCVAQYDYDANTEEELTIKENDVLYIMEDDDPEWWKAKLKTADPNDLHIGLVPSNYVEPLPASGTVVGLYQYEATTEEELTFEEGDELTLYEQDDPDWFLVGNGTQVGFVPGNYVEVSAGQDGHTQAQQTYEQEEYAEEQYQHEEQPYEEEPAEVAPRSNGSVSSPVVSAEKDDLCFWSVNEVDKKKKKKKGSLGVGNFTIFFGSEEDKSPVRQWSIKDVDKVRQEKKHVYLDLGGANPASFDFSAATKQEAEAIFNKIQESKQKSRISAPGATAAAASIPPVRDSVVSTSTYQTAQESPHIASASATYQQEAAYDEPAYDEPAYQEEEQQYVEPEPLCEGRWAIALYDFQAEAEEELSIKENDELWVTDYVSSEEWWKVQLGDQVGIVPASYVRFADEPIPEEQQEEIVQAEEVAPVEARAVPAPPPQPVVASIPKVTEQIKREIATTPAATPAPAPAAEPAVNKPKNTRMWTDRSGKYKVEAEYLGFHDGKISLHKLNGVKIAVPVREMSQEDITFVEKATGMKISESGFDWYDFFIKAGIATEDALRYSTVFRSEKMDSSILPELTRDVLKGLNVKEGDIIRIRKASGNSGATSPDAVSTAKPKKSVSFAPNDGADMINDREVAMKLQADEVSNARTSGASMAEQRRQQELADEQFARELQERENAQNRTPVFGKKNDTPQRKNTRPKASTSAPKTIDASEFTKIGTALNNTPKSSVSFSKGKQPAASKPVTTAADLAFDDDAWEVRDPKLLAFDYDNWKIQNRDNEDEWIEKFASSTVPKVLEEEEPEKTASPKPKEAETSSPAGRPRPGAPDRTDSSNSLSSFGLAVPIAPSPAPAPAPASVPAPASPAKPATPVPGSLEAIKITQAEEAERVRQQMEKIKEKQASDAVKRELEQVKQQTQMLQQALVNQATQSKQETHMLQQALVQQANQNQQLMQTVARRLAPPPPVSSGRLPAPLVPVNPTGPLRFIPTHPTGQQSAPQPTFSTASMGLPSAQQQMMTGVNPQMTGIAPQATGKANWANATPANPFGIGAITVNPTGAPRPPPPPPQHIIAARSAPPVPAPFINRNMSNGPPPPPPPMQTSMATGFNNMAGVNSNMTGMNSNMTGFNNNNNMSPMNRVSQPMQSVPFQTPAVTGMTTSGPSLNALSAMSNQNNLNNMNNMNNMNNSNSPQFQTPMMTGMNNNAMGGLNNNMAGMNNNNLGGLNSNMTGMGGLNNNMTGMNSLNNNMTGMNSLNKSPSFNSSPLGQSRILQTSSSTSSGFNSGLGGNLGGGLSNNNNLNTLSGINSLGGTSSGGSLTPLQVQATGNLPMSSSYMRPPTSSGMGNFNNNNNLGGMQNQMTGMGSMSGLGGGLNSNMAGMGGLNNNNNMSGMGGMNNNMTGMGGMNSNMTGMGGMNNNMGGMNNNMGGMGGMGRGMGGMNNMGGMGSMGGGINPQMTGMGNNMGGMNGMGGMNNMGGMNPQMTGMNNMNNMNNNGQFNRNW
ncbi:cytoskeletal protein binding protein [Entomortierella chlamydospora]|uniref:Actin cytoskeleton-regulatory complex protein SLA1 n=1 Tax=Entomortierella chlamydospora TaxID=101097 RepID=A0A9P6SW83_9FUNG|nr:cytoskeletal protein binding protein [Entomortierella chlamydospora]KAG0008088.1 cytoskeletal protein binding protein [Entomortierella chlamydospora]